MAALAGRLEDRIPVRPCVGNAGQGAGGQDLLPGPGEAPAVEAATVEIRPRKGMGQVADVQPTI
jgi:hypothetical protein